MNPAAPPESGFAPGLRAGMLQALPLAAGVAAYGLAYGVLAGQAGMSLAQGLGMSGLVFAGASQFVALGLWSAAPPVAALVLAALAVNLRHVLMGAALWPRLAGTPRGPLLAALFFMADENWALTLASGRRGPGCAGFLAGSGLALYAAWAGATGAGLCAGALVPDPARLGLDFAFTAMFVALLAGLWRGKGDIWPWLAAAAVALAVERWAPGKWHILAGGLAGGVAGALRHGR